MPSSTPAPLEDESRPTNVGLLFAALMVTMLLASLNQTVLATALPTMVGELHGVDQMTWVISGYILASTIMMPIYGRVSDQLGRKPVIISAIALFMVGSVLGGLAQDMPLLIAARVVQGLGAGGLMILSQAAIADVVPARERGRYMGYLGAVFAVSSVAGPLLGGWFTEGPGWRWAFWINLPLGALAITAVAFFLHLPSRRGQGRPKLDYLGMALLAAATTALVLASTWGGSTFEWTSPQILGLIGAFLVLAAVFVWAESRAASPVIPLGLFRARNFTLTATASLAVGVMMFGTIGYMPTYLQMVTGVDATEAGLLMIPMMGGLLVSSIVSGQMVSRSGRYKAFPLAGSVLMAIALVLVSTLRVESPLVVLCAYICLFGVGIGMSMQILTLIVQNTFPNTIVGTATAANNYFRQVGATLGSAVVGSLFASRLTTELVAKFTAAGGLPEGVSINSLTPAGVNALPEEVRSVIVHAYNHALMPIFAFLVPLAVVALVALLFLREVPLATSVTAGAPSEPPVGREPR